MKTKYFFGVFCISVLIFLGDSAPVLADWEREVDRNSALASWNIVTITRESECYSERITIFCSDVSFIASTRSHQ